MSESSHVERILAEEEDWYALFLRYGLFFGAIFQLACIGACIFLSNTDGQCSSPTELRDGKIDENNSQNINKRLHHRTRKQDKKKRR